MKGEAELVGDANTSLALHDSASPSTSSSPGGLRLELLLSLLLIGALLIALVVAWRTRKACQRKAALQRSAPVALGKLQSHAAWPNFAYLVGLGFPRAKVAQALRASSNDLPDAMTWLRQNAQQGEDLLSTTRRRPSQVGYNGAKGKRKRATDRDADQAPISSERLEEWIDDLPSEDDLAFFERSVADWEQRDQCDGEPGML